MYQTHQSKKNSLLILQATPLPELHVRFYGERNSPVFGVTDWEEMDSSNQNKKSKNTVTKVSVAKPILNAGCRLITLLPHPLSYHSQWRSVTLTGNPEDHAHWVKRVSHTLPCMVALDAVLHDSLLVCCKGPLESSRV